ncbi:MAG: hypothetical protein M1820_003250 [Bogoriella megaspora]|nr:MAG: hypothetical protein M1820_003250 [Bogoriella megaspora]
MLAKIAFACLSFTLLISKAQAAMGIAGPLLREYIAQPSVIRLNNGTYYVFSSSNGKINVPIAESDTTDIRGSWHSISGVDALPQPGTWTDGTWLMYYTAYPKNQGTNSHGARKPCIGVAASKRHLGPYIADPNPYICSYNGGVGTGFTGANRFTAGAERWMVYRNGSVLNPQETARIYLKRVSGPSDISTTREIYSVHRNTPQLNAGTPAIVNNRGVWFLFYSAGFYGNKNYRIDYATATSKDGPYTYGGILLQTGVVQGVNITGPGGPDFVGPSSTSMVFMAYGPDAVQARRDGTLKGTRRLYTATLKYKGREVSLAT